MVFALIIAGGAGKRMGETIPKQFLQVEGKPILVHTLEKFQNHPMIDDIYVVCIQGWEDYVSSFITKYDITKLKVVVTGGETALDSIKRGVGAITADKDDIIVIHDGVRPLIDEESIKGVIEDAFRYGGAICALPMKEHIVIRGEKSTDVHYLPRENAFRTVTPQAYQYKVIRNAYTQMETTGIGKDSPFIGTLMMDLGIPVCLSKCQEYNIKLTTPIDLSVFKEILIKKDEK